MADDFQSRSANFLHEFKSQAGATFHPDLDIADLRSQGRGRGVIARSDIPADTVLFTIPRDYVISVESSPLYQKHPDVLDELDLNGRQPSEAVSGDNDNEELDLEVLPKSWLSLILVLVHDFFHHSTSKWKHYWDVLPHEFDTLMFWTDAEINELQASAIRKHIGKDKADRMFRDRVIPIIKRHALIFHPDASTSPPILQDDEALLTLCHRMGSLIMSYAFDLDTRGGNAESDDGNDPEDQGEDGWLEDRDEEAAHSTAMGMVPLADTLNADAEFNAHLEHEPDRLVMRSLRVIPAGAEVLNYYGPLPNCDLARRYGYTSALHTRYDVVEIEWSTILHSLRQVFPSLPDPLPSNINGVNTDDSLEILEETFVLERETDEPDETGQNKSTPHFTTFPEDLVDQVTTHTTLGLSSSSHDQTASASKPDKPQLKLAFLQVMRLALRARLAEYPTSLAEDKVLLDQLGSQSTTNDGDSNEDHDIMQGVSTNLNGSGRKQVRREMALNIRIGEKELLCEASAVVDRLMEKYTGAESSSKEGSRPAKRVKRK